MNHSDKPNLIEWIWFARAESRHSHYFGQSGDSKVVERLGVSEDPSDTRGLFLKRNQLSIELQYLIIP